MKMLTTRWLTIIILLVPAAVAFYAAEQNVDVLNGDKFERNVMPSDEIWIVEFYAPWCTHCEKFVPEFNRLAESIKGVVRTGAVDCKEHEIFCRGLGVTVYPTLKTFYENKKDPVEYTGTRKAEAIIDYLLSVIGKVFKSRLHKTKNPVYVLTEKNFDKTVLKSEESWLVEFYAPWCGHCKKLEPELKAAAREMLGKVKVGALDATVNPQKATEYGVEGYPSIKFFPAGYKTKYSMENYAGGRSANEIVEWTLERAAQTAPDPEVVEIAGEEVVMKVCEKAQLCVVAFLPHLLDCNAKCRLEYLATLKRAAKEFKVNQWGWLWSEAQAQPEIEQSLGIGNYGYPTMAVVNAKKKKYTLLKGSFTDTGIADFLKVILAGGKAGGSFDITANRMPTIKNVDPWDGKEPDQDREYEDSKDEL